MKQNTPKHNDFAFGVLNRANYEIFVHTFNFFTITFLKDCHSKIFQNNLHSEPTPSNYSSDHR